MIISYVTTEYKKQGERLADCLNKFNVPFHIEFMESFGTSKDHKIYKPFFLEKMFNKFSSQTLTLIDGDSYFLKEPLNIQINCDMGIVLGKQHKVFQYWMSDAYHIHCPTKGTKEFIRIWKTLCKDRDWIRGNNHPRIMAAFYLSRRITTFEFINLQGTFCRNYNQKDAMVY